MAACEELRVGACCYLFSTLVSMIRDGWRSPSWIAWFLIPLPHPNLAVSILGGDLDPTQPIWDIQGSFTQYQCSQAGPSDNAYARTHNCSTNDMPTATCYCYKNTSGAWRDVGHGTPDRQHSAEPDAAG